MARNCSIVNISKVKRTCKQLGKAFTPEIVSMLETAVQVQIEQLPQAAEPLPPPAPETIVA